jgi:GMP synthase (glutamine-hydrolysing)
MRPLCILVTGDPVPRTIERRGGFAELIRETSGGSWSGDWRSFDVRTGDVPPDLSASSVTSREPWILSIEGYLAEAVQRALPVLGICFGHQLLGQALGGLVLKNPHGREMGTVQVELLESDPLLDHGDRPFMANMSHQDSVIELPPGARVLARTEREPYAALRFSPTAWGVQFHPEFDRGVVTDYVEARADALRSEGQDPDRILSDAQDTPGGRSVLKRFIEYALRDP